MSRKASTQPNDVELAILRIRWDRGPTTVREVPDPQVYRPAVPEARTQRRIVDAPIRLAIRAVESEHVGPADLAEIPEPLKQIEGGKP